MKALLFLYIFCWLSVGTYCQKPTDIQLGIFLSAEGNATYPCIFGYPRHQEDACIFSIYPIQHYYETSSKSMVYFDNDGDTMIISDLDTTPIQGRGHFMLPLELAQPISVNIACRFQIKYSKNTAICFHIDTLKIDLSLPSAITDYIHNEAITLTENNSTTIAKPLSNASFTIANMDWSWSEQLGSFINMDSLATMVSIAGKPLEQKMKIGFEIILAPVGFIGFLFLQTANNSQFYISFSRTKTNRASLTSTNSEFQEIVQKVSSSARSLRSKRPIQPSIGVDLTNLGEMQAFKNRWQHALSNPKN